jgi:hypothetical protein
VRMLEGMRPPLQVCEAVLAEVFFRIQKEGGNPELVWNWLAKRFAGRQIVILAHHD